MSTHRIVTPLGGPLDDDGFLARVELEDGTEIALVPQTYGNVLLTRGAASGWTGWAEGWTFTSPGAATLALAVLVADSSAAIDGWIRYRGRGRSTRRRSPCRVCGRILEYGDDEDGVAEPPPACSHDADRVD